VKVNAASLQASPNFKTTTKKVENPNKTKKTLGGKSFGRHTIVSTNRVHAFAALPHVVVR
jgi:hypothetical protein